MNEKTNLQSRLSFGDEIGRPEGLFSQSSLHRMTLSLDQ